MNPFRQNSLVTVILLLNLVLMACAPSTSDKKSVQVFRLATSGFSEDSCKYGYHEGPAALPKVSPSITTTYFSKKLDENLLKPVLAASAAEVVRFAESTGVKFYRSTSNTNNSCALTAELPIAPTQIEDTFSDSGQDVLGLYLPATNQDSEMKLDLAVIMVRADVSKWTLVHEYMHHIFQLQNRTDGVDASKFEIELSQAESDYQLAKEKIKDAPEAEKIAAVKLAAIKLVEYNKSLIAILKSFFLEEMTIEMTLWQAFEKKEMTLVHENQLRNSASYIINSSQSATHFLEMASQENNMFLERHLSRIDAEGAAKLKQAEEEVEAINSEMSKMVSIAENYLKDLGGSYDGFNGIVALASKSKSKSKLPGCSHARFPKTTVPLVKK